NRLPEAGMKVTGTLPLTRSAADAVSGTNAPPPASVASTVSGPGNVRTGGVVSTTSTEKDVVATLPAKSVAVAVTVVVPRGNTLPDGGAKTTSTVPSLSSVALAV